MLVAVQNGEFIKSYKPDAKILYSTDERVELLEALVSILNRVSNDFRCRIVMWNHPPGAVDDGTGK